MSVALRPERRAIPLFSSSRKRRLWLRWSIAIQAIKSATTSAAATYDVTMKGA
jgi:hypothetical protein